MIGIISNNNQNSNSKNQENTADGGNTQQRQVGKNPSRSYVERQGLVAMILSVLNLALKVYISVGQKQHLYYQKVHQKQKDNML